MKRKLRFALFAALAFTATTLFGGYLDTHDWRPMGSGSWSCENDVLEGTPEEDGYNAKCAITVSGRGWLSFRWRVVDREDETKAIRAYGYESTYSQGQPEFYVYTNGGTTGWKTKRLAHRGLDADEIVIEFEDYEEQGGKIQITDIAWESDEGTSATVKFELCGGTFKNGESTTMVCTNHYASLPTPVRTNCTFLGWTEEKRPSTSSTLVSAGTALPLGSAKTTLYAVWDVPAEEAIDPTGALRNEERGNWIEFGESVSVWDVSATWTSRLQKSESGFFESVREWAGESVSVYVENDGSDEIDLLTLYVHGCGSLDFTSVNAYLYGNNSNAELALLIDGEEIKVLSDDAAYKELDGQYEICCLAGYLAEADGLTPADEDYDLHEVRIVVRPKNTSSYGFEFTMFPIRWTEASGMQTVTFDARGGSAAGTKTYSIGSAYGSLPQPSRSGATFKGWFTEPDGGEQVVASEFVRPSVTTLYARWTASLSTALGGSLTFTSTNNDWIGSADVSRQNDGSWSATTDNVQYGVTNVMSTTVTGRGIISFWWMQGLDAWLATNDLLGPSMQSLTLWVDGRQVAEYKCNQGSYFNPRRLFGSEWQHLAYAIEGSGTHKVELRYTPGGSREDAWDAGKIEYTIASYNEWSADWHEWFEQISSHIYAPSRIYAPGAWVQDVSWSPAGEVNDFVTWTRGAAEGRSWLTNELPTIEAFYTRKIKNDPRDYESVLLRALTKVAQLGENANLLAVLKKFGYTPDYQNLGTFLGELDYGEAPLSNDVVDSVAEESVPVLESALADLESIPDSWTGSVALSPDVYPVDETTFVDLADVTFARAAVKGALASLAIAQSYDLSLDYAKLESRIAGYDSDAKTRPTIQQIVNDHPNALKRVRSKSRLAEGKKLLREALETAQAADRRMLARSTDELHFFEYDSTDEEKIQFARDEIAKGLNALDSTAVLTDDDFAYCRNYRLENLNQSVSLKPFFAGKLTRAYLGTEFDEKGRPVLDSFPDIAFGGIAPGLKKSTVASWFASYGVDVGEVTDSVTPVTPDPDPVTPDPDPVTPVTPDPDPVDPDPADERLCDDIGDAADLSSAKVYQGCLYDEDGNIAGSIQVKAAKSKTNRKTGVTTSKVTVTIQVAGETKKTKATGTLDVAEGSVSLTTKDGRELELEIGSNGMAGTFDGYEFDGVRDLFSSKDSSEKSSVNAVANELKSQGALAIVWQDEETAGWNMLSVTVAAKGKAKVSGTLANGTKVSVSTQLVVGEEVCCIPVSYSKKGANLSFGVWIERDGLDMDVTGLGDDIVAGRASGIDDDATFSLDVDALAELLGDDTYADYLPDGISVRQNGTKWVVADGEKAGKVVLNRKTGEIDESKLGENPSGLKLTFKAKDGTFKGSFKAYANVKDKPRATTVSVSGVVVNGVGYGTATIKKIGAVSVRVE